MEELQAFTSQWVPNPHWVRTEDIVISANHIDRAADHVQAQLGTDGVEAVGGSHWWQWRQEGNPLEAEWIEMRKHYNDRKHNNEDCSRCMLYVHGGAYYFGSVDEHRYQMQRHARKLQARVLAPRYRLAPQYPFPCGLLDCLAAYLYLLTMQPPETIILAGDSAGGGMIVSLLVILRDQGIPLPAGAILLSPWVDLTHSFPSVSGWNEMDYVPAHGFLHRPSRAWPPPNSDELHALENMIEKGVDLKRLNTKELGSEVAKEVGIPVSEETQEAIQGFSIEPAKDHESSAKSAEKTPARYADHARNLSILINEIAVDIKDQVQIYTTNLLLSHPLVSPVVQPSLGGLPPLLVLVGGGEMLRDEQIFLAHKAANPTAYRPSNLHLSNQGPHAAEQVSRWLPTNVQLQVWEDLCHVAPTLSFTRPAKYMYRSVAQFGAWALARAQQREIEILDDDDISVISSAASSGPSSRSTSPNRSHSTQEHSHNANSTPPPNHVTNPHALSSHANNAAPTSLGKAGAPLTPFKSHMIRQLVNRHGDIYPLASASTLPACTMAPEEIGVIKAGPVGKWLEAQKRYGRQYAREKLSLQAQRMREMQGEAKSGDAWFGRGGLLEGDKPPPTALVGRVAKGGAVGKEEGMRGKKHVGGRALKIWSGWGSMHDEHALEKEEAKEKEEDEEGGAAAVRTASFATPSNISYMNDENTHPGTSLGVPMDPNTLAGGRRPSRSRVRSVVDEGQILELSTRTTVMP